jgi:hypothetical protein
MSLDDYIKAGGNKKAFKRDVTSSAVVVDVPEDLGPLERSNSKSRSFKINDNQTNVPWQAN